MPRIGPLQWTESWKYALIGGLLALPFTALEVWRTPEDITLEMFVVGSLLAGYLVKRHGGDSMATGLRAGVIGGFPALWILPEMLLTLANIPNPPWFQAVSIVLSLAFGGVVLLLLATLGALAGRVGGWLAERRGHGGTANTTDSASQNTH